MDALLHRPFPCYLSCPMLGFRSWLGCSLRLCVCCCEAEPPPGLGFGLGASFAWLSRHASHLCQADEIACFTSASSAISGAGRGNLSFGMSASMYPPPRDSAPPAPRPRPRRGRRGRARPQVPPSARRCGTVRFPVGRPGSQPGSPGRAQRARRLAGGTVCRGSSGRRRWPRRRSHRENRYSRFVKHGFPVPVSRCS